MSFGDFLVGIFAPGEQARGEALDAANNALTRQQQARGIISEEQARRNIESVNAPDSSSSYYGDLMLQDWNEGIQEGEQNVTGAINETLKEPFRFAWASLPWQVWAAAGVALFVWMGGPALLKGRLAK